MNQGLQNNNKISSHNKDSLRNPITELQPQVSIQHCHCTIRMKDRIKQEIESSSEQQVDKSLA